MIYSISVWEMSYKFESSKTNRADVAADFLRELEAVDPMGVQQICDWLGSADVEVFVSGTKTIVNANTYKARLF